MVFLFPSLGSEWFYELEYMKSVTITPLIIIIDYTFITFIFGYQSSLLGTPRYYFRKIIARPFSFVTYFQDTLYALFI